MLLVYGSYKVCCQIFQLVLHWVNIYFILSACSGHVRSESLLLLDVQEIKKYKSRIAGTRSENDRQERDEVAVHGKFRRKKR